MIRRKKIQLLFCTINILYAFGRGVSGASGSNETTDDYSEITEPSEYINTATTNYIATEYTYLNYDSTTTSSHTRPEDAEPVTASESINYYSETTKPSEYINTTTTDYNATESTYLDYDSTSTGSSSFIETTTESYCKEVPSSVQDLRVSNTTYNSIVVTWTSSTSSDECISLYNATWYSDNEYLGFQTISATESKIVISDLTPCTTLIVTLVAVGKYDTSESKSVSATTSESVPGVVIDLTAPSEYTTMSSVYLSWSTPTVNPSCILHYEIERCYETDCTTDTTRDEFYNATSLDPCLTYNFAVTAVGIAGSSDAEGIAVTTLYTRPERPTNMSIIPGQFSLNISWEAPLVGGTCTSSYRVTLWESGQTETTVNTNVVMSGLVACKNYTVQITPISTTSADGEFDTVSGITEESVNDPPSLYIEDPVVTTSTISITWNINTTMNECELKTILTNCYFDSTDGHGFEMVNGTSEDDISGFSSSDNITITATVISLSPYSWYTCAGMTENIAGYSETTTNVTARTSEDVPSAPNITASDIRSSTFTLTWEEPEYLAGNLTGHEILLEFERLFHVPASCNYSNSNSSDYISDIDGSTFLYSYTNATPYSNYTARIRAKTGAGWGNYSNYHRFETSVDVPGVVNNVTCSIRTNSIDLNLLDTFLSWGLPCELNGNIEVFQIYYSGTRNGFMNDTSILVHNVTEATHAEMTFEINLGELKAEYNYTFQISPKVVGVSELGPSTSYNVIYPAGIPPRPSDTYMKNIKVNPFDAQRSSSTAYVLLPLFENTNGDIKYYAIMIAEANYNNMSYSRFDTLSGDWPSTPSWQQAMSHTPITRYQATEIRWQPDETYIINSGNLTAVRYQLGENESCAELLLGDQGSTTYCNGPLRPDTWYQVRMRAFTNGGYRDSLAVLAKTEAEFNVGLVVGVVFGILFFGIITTMMLLIRKGVLQTVVGKLLHPNVSSSPGPEPLTRKKFEFHCQELIENPGKLSNEFQLLQTLSVDLEMSAHTAVLQANRKKNRYINILPYDITRVKLDVLNNDPNTDYINASFIKGYHGSTEYIACQGPKEETTYDFWRMVFQYNVKVIVMVTQLVEKGKDKCHQYYPNTREHFEYEDMTIRCSSQLDRVFYKQRTITLQKDNVKRTIMHLHFKEWTDHGVPDDIHSMISFCQIMRRHIIDSKSLAVIHCSAGVGRTGTLIAIDILLQQIRDNKKLDVFGTVYKLRQHRMNMVQTESQYAYIYNCIKQVVNNPKAYKTPSVEPIYENILAKQHQIRDSNTNFLNSAETLKKISPSVSMNSMEPISENSMPVRPVYTRQLSTLSNGLRYSKSTSAIDTQILPSVHIVRYGSDEYPIFEPAPDIISTRGSFDRNSLLEFIRPIRIESSINRSRSFNYDESSDQTYRFNHN